jgi:hypothetical protein
MMNRIYIIIITIIFVSCNIDNCSKKLKYTKLNYYLFSNININGDTYCDLVNKSLLGNKKSIVNLSKIAVYDGAVYEHGAVLLEVIDKISETEYVNIIIHEQLTKNERRYLLNNLSAGLDYTKNEKWYQFSSINDLYPSIYKILSR